MGRKKQNQLVLALRGAAREVERESGGELVAHILNEVAGEYDGRDTDAYAILIRLVRYAREYGAGRKALVKPKWVREEHGWALMVGEREMGFVCREDYGDDYLAYIGAGDDGFPEGAFDSLAEAKEHVMARAFAGAVSDE